MKLITFLFVLTFSVAAFAQKIKMDNGLEFNFIKTPRAEFLVKLNGEKVDELVTDFKFIPAGGLNERDQLFFKTTKGEIYHVDNNFIDEGKQITKVITLKEEFAAGFPLSKIKTALFSDPNSGFEQVGYVLYNEETDRALVYNYNGKQTAIVTSMYSPVEEGHVFTAQSKFNLHLSERTTYFQVGTSTLAFDAKSSGDLVVPYIKTAEGKMTDDIEGELKKDFTILTKKDLTPKQIAEAKSFVGSQDFTNILEDFIRGSVAVLGEAGEGKTYICQQFYNAALAGLIPQLKGVESVLVITATDLQKGTMYVGTFDAKLEAIKAYYRNNEGKTIVFVDEVHTLKGTGTSKDNPTDGLQKIKTAMSVNHIKLLATTTNDEYLAMVGGDDALARRFPKVFKQKYTELEQKLIIRKVIQNFGQPVPSDEIVDKILLYSNEFDVVGSQPARAIKLIGKATAKNEIANGKNHALDLATLNKTASEMYQVDPDILNKDKVLEKIKGLEKSLDTKIVGQELLKDKLIEATEIRYTGFSKKGVPPLRMLLTGPPGVGKTYTAKVYGDHMGFPTKVISFNDYAGHYTADKFLNEVASALRKNAFTILIFDEYEKASMPVQTAVLQMLNEGKFTQQEEIGGKQSRTVTIDTRNTSFILTSNMGDQELKNMFVQVYKAERGKTADVNKSDAATKAELAKELTKEELEKLLISKGMNTAVMDRMDYIVAVLPPTENEFKKSVALHFNYLLKEYEENVGVKIHVENMEEMLNSVIKNYVPGDSNRDANRLIAQKLVVELKDYMKENPANFKLKEVSYKFKTEKLLPKVLPDESTDLIRKIVSVHELEGHWMVGVLLSGENYADHVSMIPGKGYLGYVMPKAKNRWGHESASDV